MEFPGKATRPVLRRIPLVIPWHGLAGVWLQFCSAPSGDKIKVENLKGGYHRWIGWDAWSLSKVHRKPVGKSSNCTLYTTPQRLFSGLLGPSTWLFTWPGMDGVWFRNSREECSELLHDYTNGLFRFWGCWSPSEEKNGYGSSIECSLLSGALSTCTKPSTISTFEHSLVLGKNRTISSTNWENQHYFETLSALTLKIRTSFDHCSIFECWKQLLN